MTITQAREVYYAFVDAYEELDHEYRRPAVADTCSSRLTRHSACIAPDRPRPASPDTYGFDASNSQLEVVRWSVSRRCQGRPPWPLQHSRPGELGVVDELEATTTVKTHRSAPPSRPIALRTPDTSQESGRCRRDCPVMDGRLGPGDVRLTRIPGQADPLTSALRGCLRLPRARRAAGGGKTCRRAKGARALSSGKSGTDARTVDPAPPRGRRSSAARKLRARSGVCHDLADVGGVQRHAWRRLDLVPGPTRGILGLEDDHGPALVGPL